jgi:Tfp pilus assembly protein PilF
LLEKAEKIDGNALDGSAHTSLGALYYQVPAWPIGFGSKDKAREELTAGLRANPRGIDSNYFWGDFLYNQGQYAEAAKTLRTALAAPPRPGREVADAGRRGEVQKLLAAVDGKLGG